MHTPSSPVDGSKVHLKARRRQEVTPVHQKSLANDIALYDLLAELIKKKKTNLWANCATKSFFITEVP